MVFGFIPECRSDSIRNMCSASPESPAGQICRELTVSDHGIDMEIEFKDPDGDATGSKLYLQLKSGDSYIRKRQRDGAEVFDIPKDRHTEY
jgi:hypothetical protein